MILAILEKDTKIKYWIIDYLDQAKGEVSFEELKHEISEHLNFTAIRDHCLYLVDLVQTIYPNDEVELFLTPTTIYLKKHSSNLQFLFETLLQKDINNQILHTLIYKRKFNTDLFCYHHGLSMSTLRRKNQQLNDLLVSFNLHITTSSRLTTLNGRNFEIYLFSFFYLFWVYHDTSRLPHLKYQEHLDQLTVTTAHYLDASWDIAQTKNVKLLIYVINNNTQFHQSEKKINDAFYIPYLIFPDKPTFLKHWTANDWQAFLLIMNGLELFDFSLPLNVQYLPSRLVNYIKIWTATFENYFIKLTNQQKKELQAHLTQQALIKEYFPYNQTALTYYKSLNPMVHFNEDYPVYTIRFASFWAAVRAKISEPHLGEAFYLSVNLLLCLYLCPLENLREHISIFILSNLGTLSLSYIKNELISIFQPRAIPDFVDSIEKADLVLSLLPTVELTLLDQQERVVISYPLQYNDRMKLIHSLKKCLLKKSKIPLIDTEKK